MRPRSIPARVLALALLAPLLLTAACAPSGQRARVTAYLEDSAPRSLKDLPLSVRLRPGQAGSLLNDRARTRMVEELTALGAKVTSDDDTSAPWVLTFTHGTDSQRVEYESRPVMTGHVSHGPPPFFGDPWESRTVARTSYPHWLVLTLHDAQTLGDRDPANVPPVSELRVERSSASPDIAATLPTLIRAAVWAFPGQEGRDGTITVPRPSP